MGGKSRGGSVGRDTTNTMNRLARGQTSNATMQSNLNSAQNSNMGSLLNVFDALAGNANSRFDSHPMFSIFSGGNNDNVAQMDDRYGKFRSRLGLFSHLMGGGDVGTFGDSDLPVWHSLSAAHQEQNMPQQPQQQANTFWAPNLTPEQLQAIQSGVNRGFR